MKGVGADAIVNFNQGYVFDYQAASTVGVNKIKVTDTYIDYSAAGDLEFYVEILTAPDRSKVNSASIKEGSISSSSNFHYNAQELDGGGNAYTNGEGIFKIPLCKISNGNIQEIYLRENIHWQKINFANTEIDQSAANSFGVLASWGDSSSVFGDSPPVKFKRITQKSSGDDEIIPEHIIEIQNGNGGDDIIITTQFPKVPKDVGSLLFRKSDNTWEWTEIPENKAGVIGYYNNELQFIENTTNGYYLKSDDISQPPTWAAGGAGGDGLPAGNQGDILYHNGTNWVTLAKPTSTPAFLNFADSAVAPDWLYYGTETLTTCAGDITVLTITA